MRDDKNQIKKIRVINADFALDDLGLNEIDTQLLISQINVVFHCAATVRFMEPLKQAVQINVEGVKSFLDLARQMKQLKAFVHVSTAYSFSNRREIDEIVYKPRFKTEEIINLVDILDEEFLIKRTPL